MRLRMYGMEPIPKEGDLYREITIEGKNFRLCYGYYEDFERDNPHIEPMPIYPDFIRIPEYTQDGIPFVIAMQDVCRHYSGSRAEDNSCSDCWYFQKSEDLFGFCQCPHNKRPMQERMVEENA